MNKTIKRFFLAVQVIACVLMLCVNISATSNSTVSNNGIRHVQCVSLSESAEAYYTDYAYDVLSEQDSSQLLTTLRQLMKSTHSYISSYNDCRDMASRIDSNGTDGKITLLYTSVSVTRAEFGGNADDWNREHVWPKSLGGFETTGAGADLHHIRPSDAAVNTKRSNRKYGNVTNGTNATGSTLVNGVSGGMYSGSYFEPLDNVKGDVARICLYVYVRYGGELSKCSSITNVFQSVDVLLEWCALDPVDEWEMSRNDVIEDIQGNRNVFIDYPEYAWLIFDRELSSDMVTPSGEAKQTTPGTTPGVTSDTTPNVTPDTTLPDQDDGCVHSFDEWEDVGNGQMMRICGSCGKVDIRDKSELGDDCTHKFDEWEDVGEDDRMRICEYCGKVEIETKPEQGTDTSVSGGGCTGAGGVTVFAPFIALLCTAGFFIIKKK